MITPNKPFVLTVYFADREDGNDDPKLSFHKTRSAAYERLADMIRRDEETFSHYTLKWRHGE